MSVNETVGDAAALREALEELMKFTCNCCQERYCEEDVEEEDGQRIPSPCSVIIKARAALNLGRRQCDVGTAEEIDARWNAYCAKRIKRENCMSNKNCKGCAWRWAQMPYEEGGN